MAERQPPLLSELATRLDAPSDRRTFLSRAGLLTLAIPGVGAALTACSPGSVPNDSAAVKAGTVPDTGEAQEPRSRIHNSDSRLDSSLLKGEHRAPTSATGSATQGASSTAYQRYAPELPPLPAGGTQKIHFHAKEVPIRISDDTVFAAWTFEGQFPGPIIHTRVGDTVEFTLTNDALIPHSMDFHAAQIDPKHAFKSVAKDQSVTFTFKPKWAGAFMYHCGTAPVLMHIGAGMHGAIIVSPREPLPPSKEYVLVHSELYLDEAPGDTHAANFQKMLNTMPDLVVFNGRPNQYIKDPIRVKVGDRVRFWVVSAGPQYQCAFHVVGEQFDTVYLGAPPNSAIRGVQTFAVPPGGGMVFELVCDIPGEFPFVNHSFGHGQKGAIGILVVE